MASKIFGILVGVVVFVVLSVGIMFLHGFVLTQLWTWFVTPLTGITISLVHALGLYVIYSCVTGQANSILMKVDERTQVEKITSVAALPLFALGIGYILTLFM